MYIAVVVLYMSLHSIPGRMMEFIFKYGLIIGIIGFSLGFFGPIVFVPEANQGPLLGIFITGPLGFIAGIILGTIFRFMQKRDPKFKHPLHTMFPG
jgi:hypothetical protein